MLILACAWCGIEELLSHRRFEKSFGSTGAEAEMVMAPLALRLVRASARGASFV